MLSECSLHVYTWQEAEVISGFKKPCGIPNALGSLWEAQFPRHSSGLAPQEAQQNSTYDITNVPQTPPQRDHPWGRESTADHWLCAEAATQGAN